MALTDFLASFTVPNLPTTLLSGMPLSLTAVPNDKLAVPLTEIISAPLDLQLVFRHVQVPNDLGEIPWPREAVAGLNITSGLIAEPDQNTLEAWIGKLTGTLPLGVRDINLVYRWNLSCAFGDETFPVEVIGGDLASRSVTIAVPPIFNEMLTLDFDAELQSYLNDLTQLAQLKISFTVAAWVGTEQRSEFTTPEIAIPIQPIPLPSVAALFRDQNFGGDAVMIMVPETSAIASGATDKLLEILGRVSSTIQSLQSAASLASWALGLSALLSAVKTLTTQVPTMEHVALRRRREKTDLGKDNFITRWHWDTDIEDRGSSALIISARQAISFFQHDDFGGAQIALDARPDASLSRLGGALVANLHVAQPQSVPPGCVVQTGTPGSSWGDSISSYRWAHPLPV